jgi:biopolymer transport protein ExbD
MTRPDSPHDIKSEINVTPLVDVMLVLLIIMMLIAPLLHRRVELTLPTAQHRVEKPDTAEQTVVYIDAQNKLIADKPSTAAGGQQ